jgi:hypothetical protein
MFFKKHPEFDPLGYDLRKHIMILYERIGRLSIVELYLSCCTACYVITCLLVVGSKDLVSLVDVNVESYSNHCLLRATDCSRDVC